MRRRSFLIAAGVAGLLCVFGLLWLIRPFSPSEWGPPAPGTVVAESFSSDGEWTARVAAGTAIGEYVFDVRDRTGGVVASRKISAPVGYHTHRVTLEWQPETNTVVAVIDHDFGENNLRFTLGP